MEEIEISECKNLGSQNECFAEPQIGYCGNFNGYEKCANLSDCYYKQLLQKEKECEELKKQLSAERYSLYDTGEDLEELYEVNQELKKENDKLKQTLQKIKEYANRCLGDADRYYILQIISEVEK